MFNYRKQKANSKKSLRLESLETRLLLSVNSPTETEYLDLLAACSSSSTIPSGASTCQVEYPSALSLNATSAATTNTQYTLGSKLQENDMIYFHYTLPSGGKQDVYLRINHTYNSSATSVNVSLRTNSSMGIVRDISYWKDATVTYRGDVITIQYRNFDACYHVNQANQTAYLQDDDVTITINKNTDTVTFSTTNYGTSTSSCRYGQWTGNALGSYNSADLVANGGGTLSQSGNTLTVKNVQNQKWRLHTKCF